MNLPVADKSMKYEKLIDSIDFFSQIMHIEQLSKYGHQHVHDLLEVKNSAVYIKSECNGYYRLISWTGSTPSITDIPASCAFDNIATKVGHVIIKDFERYFSQEFLSAYPIELMLPIIVKHELFGFFIANEYALAGQEFDPIFIEAIKNLVNTAFFIGIQRENSSRNEADMNRKLYDLLLLHQVNRLLISELDLDNLFHLCVDATRELTASAATGFAFLDERTGKITLRSYTDIVDFNNMYMEVEWIGESVPECMIYQIDDDWGLLQEVFDTPEIFREMKASHIILLAKDKVEGLITIGKPVSGIPYDQETLELVESIASTIMIAMENAGHVHQIKLQNKMLSKSYGALTTLNQAMKTLNSCESLEELGEAILQTLSLRCSMRDGYMAVWDEAEECYIITASCISERNGKKIWPTQLGSASLARGLVIDTQPGSFHSYLEEELKINSPEISILAPVSLDMIGLRHQGLLGIIVFCEHFTTMEPQWLTFMEALASSIAPTVKHLLTMQEYRMTSEEIFVNALNKMEHEKNTQFLEYRVYYKKLADALFAKVDLTPYEGYRMHRVHRMVLVLAYEEEIVDETKFDGSIAGDINTVLSEINRLDQQ